MDTIDGTVMRAAATEVARTRVNHPSLIIHTVTIELNGRHGGADVIMQGSILDGDRVSRSAEYVSEVH